MTKKEPTNVAASIHARLLNEARAQNRPFNELLQYYAMERFLYRLSRSPHREWFVLKGALMLQLWGGPHSRATKDIDLLGRSTTAIDDLVASVQACVLTEVDDDGLVFDPDSIDGAPIRIEAKYDGLRVQFRGNLGNAEIALLMDVGFGDVITPGPVKISYPTLLHLPAPELLGYTPETSIAEKLEAMVVLDVANSRMKDFFDIAFLARTRSFDGGLLSRAIEATFRRRGTPLPATIPVALTTAFFDDKAKGLQWKAFVKKTRARGEQSLPEIATEIAAFVVPVLNALQTGGVLEKRWSPGGPWTTDHR
jgi:hypothetical protein